MLTIACPGYHSEVTFPLHSVDTKAAVVDWLEMQLRYLGVRKAGSKQVIRETS
jgi:hypothetical protein